VDPEVEVAVAPGVGVLVPVLVLVRGAEVLDLARVVLVRGATQETLETIQDNNTLEVLEDPGLEAQQGQETQEVRGEIQEVQVITPDSSTPQEDPGLTMELLWVEVDS